jgi:hypothetical protein
MVILSSICFANQYDDSPDQYTKIDSGATFNTYLDKASIKSVKYAPPYYTIQCNNIEFDQTDGITAKTTVIYSYDFNTKNIQIQVPKNIAQSEDGSISYNSVRDEPPINVDPSSLSFKESIMLFKQLYGEKVANTFLNAPNNTSKSQSNVNDTDNLPSGEIV